MNDPRAVGPELKRHETAPIRWLLIASAIAFLSLFLFIPLLVVFINAFRDGLALFLAAAADPQTAAAIRLTLLVVALVLPLNVLFGLCAAWSITKFDFRGKNLLTTLIDLPLTVSPVISGSIFVLLFGAQGALGPWLASHQIRIVFAVPGIVLATLFVTFPYVARELIPLMQALGNDNEETAISLGAGSWQIFWRVTLPNIKWALLYGIILSTARAIGEFGAVSVVSGHIRGKTITVPLHVEILYNEYNFVAAFSVASLLVLVSLLTLFLKRLAEWKRQQVFLENAEHGSQGGGN
ncbi:MAG: sulfate ABC transporter permease subunit CysW [Deltaproteobacteria bacterium]|nr:sulfate ABC transporter permease subunit CysW [Deltaproteobacteria bacterium]